MGELYNRLTVQYFPFIFTTIFTTCRLCVESMPAVGYRLSLAGNTLCLGHGLGPSVDSLLATTIVLFGLIGLLLWMSCILPFMFLSTSFTSQLSFRPHCHRVYGLQEWLVRGRCVCFIYPNPVVFILPKDPTSAPLPTLWSLLNFPVPMISSITNDPSDPRGPASAAEDARKFPSDEEFESAYALALLRRGLGSALSVPFRFV
jgi:hypothetical protein